jgi:HEAT repeat protein
MGELVAAGPAGVPALARMLTSHPDPATRERAARALAQAGGSTAASALRRGLRDRDPAVRLRAAQGLARGGTKDALARLKSAAALEHDASVKAVLERLLTPLS